MFTLFGIHVEDVRLPEALARIQDFLTDGQKHLVITLNPEMLVEASRNQEYAHVLQSASLCLPDGFGLVLASYLFYQPLSKGRVTGVDLVQELIKKSEQHGYSVFLAGSTQKILDKATLNLSSNYSDINIVGTYSGANTSAELAEIDPEKESAELVSRLAETKPDILLLAYGAPKQELWLSKHLPQLPIKVGIGVGGTFDYLSGSVPQAPRLFGKFGLEWLWRLFIQPKRIRRIINAVVVFPMLVLVELAKKLFHVEQK